MFFYIASREAAGSVGMPLKIFFRYQRYSSLVSGRCESVLRLLFARTNAPSSTSGLYTKSYSDNDSLAEYKQHMVTLNV